MNRIIMGILFLVSTNMVVFASISIIPAPSDVIVKKGVFELNTDTKIVVGEFDSATTVAHYLHVRILASTGYELDIIADKDVVHSSSVILLDYQSGVEDVIEGAYALILSQTSLSIKADNFSGLFYGAQTFLQLLPPEIYSRTVIQDVKWTAPCIEIKDEPRFQWRGAMLDVSRHFFDKEFVMKFIDNIAIHKLNVLHLHLTDNPGWRIEIDKYPELTNLGSMGEYDDINGRSNKQLYFTKEDMREIVAFAKSRFVTVVPEIDMPGHAGAALRAYPELGDRQTTFNMAKEDTLDFLKNVIDEVTELFPGGYFHLGGDEVWNLKLSKMKELRKQIRKNRWKDYKPAEAQFDRNMVDYILRRGCTPMGWDEISEHDVDRKTIIYWWRGKKVEVLQNALENGYRVIAAPVDITYFDYPHQEGEEGAIWEGGLTPVKMVYDWEPIPINISSEKQNLIMGVQGQLWTEFIASEKRLEYMAFPRFAALAETGWSKAENKSWSSFQQRLKVMENRYEVLGTNYRQAEPTAELQPEGFQRY